MTTASCDPGAPIRGLLQNILSGAKPGGAWLSKAVGEFGAMSGYTSSGDETDPMVEDLTAAVRGAWAETRTRAWSASPDRALSQKLARLRHRTFLNAERFEAALPDLEWASKLASVRRAGLRYYVVLDLKFHYLLSQLRCHVSMSIWSGIPGHPEHRPGGLGRDTPLPGGADVDTCHRAFSDIADAADDLLKAHRFVPADGTIGDGAHGLPVFWVAVPNRPSDRPMDHLSEGTPHCELTNRLARTFLNVGDLRDGVVSHSVLNGHLVTLRRPEDGADGVRVSRYLMIPAGYPLARRESVLEAERNIAAIITKLTDLEAEGTSRILSAKADLEIWHNHLRVYNVVVERAVFLWDALSTHLPIRRHRKLSRSHRAVELMHQFLLQALGDLGHIAALIRQATADIADVAEDVSDTYHASITERHLAPGSGLRAALTETGLFAHTRREARETATEADRVKRAYDDLLQSIAHAFEERRVREAEVLQKYGIVFGILVGSGVIVEVLDATLDMKAPDAVAAIFGGGAELGRTASWFTWLLAGGLAVLLVRGLVLLFRIGRLGSRQFRELYDGHRVRAFLRRKFWWPKAGSHGVPLQPAHGVWQVMKDISTDRLERESKQNGNWEQLDGQLAEEYAVMWDAVTRMAISDRSDAAGHDIKALSGRVEQWGMHSLLLTERARRMYRYPLPVLTCLFRCCERIQGSFLEIGYLTRTSMIATVDLDRSLARLGFRGTELRLVDHWLTAQHYPSAAGALRRIQSLGLKPMMSHAERQAVLDVVTGGEHAPRDTGAAIVHIPTPRVSPDDRGSGSSGPVHDGHVRRQPPS
ncbi:MAG TPA: hypothetical protein VFZ32_05010 [Micromonosporaceae bacterium]